jgi:acyl-CoA thioesterase FadM
MRIEIEYPEKTVFSCQTRVRVTDLSASGHLGFDSLVAILNDASAQFFEQRGIRRNSGGIGTIYADLAVVYKSESFFADTLLVDVAIGEISDKGLDLMFRVVSRESGKTVAVAKIGVLFFDYQSHRVALIPEGILEWQGRP